MTTSRLRFAHGEWLLAADLRDAPRLPSRRLAQHHIAAHHTWGVSGGLTVGLAGDHVVVEPGVAVDRCGRVGVASRPARVRVTSGLPVVVVLAVVGDGPRATVRLRGPGHVRDLDVPLATVDELGVVHTGDTHRQWLRRPGPTVTLAGTVAKGAAVTGVEEELGRSTGWKVSVDLSACRLPGVPAVVAGLAADPVRTANHALAGEQSWQPAVQEITVEVTNVSAAGFDLVVRGFVTAPGFAAGDVPPGTRPAVVRTAPNALTWLAVLAAERPDFPQTEE